MRISLGLLLLFSTIGAAHAACNGPPEMQTCDGGIQVMRTPGATMMVGPHSTFMQTPNATMFTDSNGNGQAEAWSQTENQFGATSSYTWHSGGVGIYTHSCSGDECGRR